MKKTMLVLGLTCAGCQLFGQNKFPVSAIPDSLKKGANSVMREERIDFEVKAIGKGTCKYHQVVTVLNEGGKDELKFLAPSDEFRSLENVVIQMYDAQGKPIQKFKRSDLRTQMSGEELVPDTKIYFLELPPAGYPVTVQFDYEMIYNGLLFYPSYHFQSKGQSVESSVFNVIVPAELGLRFKAMNTTIVPTIGNLPNSKTFTWSVKNLSVGLSEENGSNYLGNSPCIVLAPTKFEMGGFVG